MGLYIEINEPKLAWCIKNQVQPGQSRAHESLPVVYFDNGPFDCVAVGFNMREIKRLKTRADGQWFVVPKAVLRGVTPGGETLKELK